MDLNITQICSQTTEYSTNTICTQWDYSGTLGLGNVDNFHVPFSIFLAILCMWFIVWMFKPKKS